MHPHDQIPSSPLHRHRSLIAESTNFTRPIFEYNGFELPGPSRPVDCEGTDFGPTARIATDTCPVPDPLIASPANRLPQGDREREEKTRPSERASGRVMFLRIRHSRSISVFHFSSSRRPPSSVAVRGSSSSPLTLRSAGASAAAAAAD